MTDIFVYTLIFLPLLTPFLVALTKIPAHLLWWVGCLVCGLNFAGFTWLFSRFYIDDALLASGLLTSTLPWSDAWGVNFQFRIDFLSITLVLALSLIFLLTMFMARGEFEKNRAKLGALHLFYVSLLGLVTAAEFPLTFLFLASLLLPEILLFGWDRAPERVTTLKKHVFCASLSTGLCLICVLAFSRPFRTEAAHWFFFANQGYELGFRRFLFLIFCGAVFLRTPTFPFQARLGCLFRLDSLECLLPLLCGSNVGFYILFRYGPSFFPGEFQEYSSFFAWLAAVQVLYSVAYLMRHGGHREHIYGTQQLWSGVLLLGFVSFGPMGWVGAWSLYITGILVIALALFVAIALERRGNGLTSASVSSAPACAAASAYGSLALLGAPFTMAFYSLVLVLWSAMTLHKRATVPILLALPILLWIGVRRLFFQYSGSDVRDTGTAVCRELDHTEALVIFAVGAVTLVCGLCPDLLLRPLGMQIDHVWAMAGMGGN